MGKGEMFLEVLFGHPSSLEIAPCSNHTTSTDLFANLILNYIKLLFHFFLRKLWMCGSSSR